MARRSEWYFLGLRWRGRLNLKDIVERAIGGFIAGVAAGVTFWCLTALLGGG